jgi:HPt (histidine-containing phosphotransfer) domain-containing protein
LWLEPGLVRKGWERSLGRGETMETTTPYTEVFDVARALSSVGGDSEFLTEIVGLTQAAWPTLLADIREGLSRGDLRMVGTRARLAKAAARNVSAKRAYESAQQLETLAVKGDLQAAQGAIASLEREVEMLRHFLATLGAGDCYA